MLMGHGFRNNRSNRREGHQSISLSDRDLSRSSLFPREDGKSFDNPTMRTTILNTLLIGQHTCKKVEGFEYSDETMNELLEASKLLLEFTVEEYITIQEDIDYKYPDEWESKNCESTKAFLRGKPSKL
jgi:hypothetical protein